MALATRSAGVLLAEAALLGAVAALPHAAEAAAAVLGLVEEEPAAAALLELGADADGLAGFEQAGRVERDRAQEGEEIVVVLEADLEAARAFGDDAALGQGGGDPAVQFGEGGGGRLALLRGGEGHVVQRLAGAEGPLQRLGRAPGVQTGQSAQVVHLVP